MRRPIAMTAALTATAALLLSACGGETEEKAGQPVVSTSVTAKPRKPSIELDQPFTKPDLVLTDTHGEKFDLRQQTEDRLTLLYFGYSHCPDTCPLVVSNLALAYQDLTEEQRDNIRIVFVTTDPERDTPKELGRWLRGAGNPDFIGLSGDYDAVEAAALSVGVGMAPPTKNEEGEIVATHGKTVLAFSPKDNKAHVIYRGQEATAKDYARDIPKLLKGQTP